jgi:mannose-6-phosphate isomerase-like protein (cupin superfamily)
MKTTRITPAQMEQRVARFSDLEPVDFGAPDTEAQGTDLPLEIRELIEFGHRRKILSIIGLESGVETVISKQAPISGAGDMTMSYAVCAPGSGPSLHTHVATFETFTVLQGQFEVTYNDDGSGRVVLDRFDVLTVPPGVVRTFHNVSQQEGILQVIITGGVHDQADLIYSYSVADRLREHSQSALDHFEGKGFRFTARDSTEAAPLLP